MIILRFSLIGNKNLIFKINDYGFLENPNNIYSSDYIVGNKWSTCGKIINFTYFNDQTNHFTDDLNDVDLSLITKEEFLNIEIDNRGRIINFINNTVEDTMGSLFSLFDTDIDSLLLHPEWTEDDSLMFNKDFIDWAKEYNIRVYQTNQKVKWFFDVETFNEGEYHMSDQESFYIPNPDSLLLFKLRWV